MKKYILRDDVIEWLADKAITWAKDYRSETGIGALEAQLAENKKATKNLLAAIEMGIITESTKERLLELEREQAMLVSKLAEENASLVSFSRDDIISALSLYRDGSVEDRAFQAKLFDAFLVAVYLYEDHFKLEFHVGGKSGIDVPLEPSVVEELGEAECSYRLAFEPPETSQTNTTLTIYMVGGVFVLVYPLSQ